MSAKKAILEKLKDIGTYLVELDNKEIIETKEIKKEEVKFAQETLDNDTVIEAEAFESGESVFIVSEDERVALPVGEYTLADGRVLVVSEEGLIDSIGEAKEESEDVDAKEEFVTKAEFNEAIDSIKAMFSKEENTKADLEKVEKDLVLSKNKEEKLQKEIDDIPDAKKIKVAPVVKLDNNQRPTTKKGRLIEFLNNR